MEKKFYEIPEVEVIDLKLDGTILGASSGTDDPLLPPIIDGEGDSEELG